MKRHHHHYNRPRYHPRPIHSKPRYNPRSSHSRPRYHPKPTHSKPRYKPRPKQKYTLKEKVLYKAKKYATKLNRGLAKKMKQTEKNIRHRRYENEKERHWNRRQEAVTRGYESRAGIMQPSIPEQVFDEDVYESAVKAKKQVSHMATEKQPAGDPMDMGFSMMFGGFGGTGGKKKKRDPEIDKYFKLY